MKSFAKKENFGIPVGQSLIEEKTFLGNIFILDDQIKFKQCNMLKYEGITEVNDITYDEKYPEYCKLDVLFDESKKGRFVEGKYPVLLDIHGGGWLVGDKSYRRGYAMQFAHEGFFVVNINYCMTPKYKFPINVQNVGESINWIYENAEKYSLDLDNFSITGDSAGGHLSAMAILCQENKEVREKLGVREPKIKIKKAILQSSVIFFDRPIFYIPIINAMIKGLTGIKKRKDYASYEYANEISPVKYINGDYPEIMVVTGRTDYFTKYQNMSLVEKLKEQGVKYQYLHIKTFLNCFHCFHLKVNMPGARRAMKESVKFLMKDIVKDVKELDSVLTYKEYLAQKR